MRVYIAGPMSGYPEHNYPAFRAAARALRERGHTIVSPHEINAEQGHEWVWYIKRDLLILLEKCDAIAFLPGWQDSRGARLEHEVAMALGYAIYDVQEGDLVKR